jgi:ribosomal protein S18 acetylase RimI-like enzyme
MLIRPAQPVDAAAIAAVNIASWRAAYRGVLSADLLDNMSWADIKQRWEKRFANAAERMFVVEQSARIIGYVICGGSRDADALPHVGEIYGLYLLPGEWGQGYGRQLMATAQNSLREQGFSEVTLWVLHQNERAQTFYLAAGFKADGVDKRETRFNNVVFHQKRYRRLL